MKLRLKKETERKKERGRKKRGRKEGRKKTAGRQLSHAGTRPDASIGAGELASSRRASLQ